MAGRTGISPRIVDVIFDFLSRGITFDSQDALLKRARLMADFHCQRARWCSFCCKSIRGTEYFLLPSVSKHTANLHLRVQLASFDLLLRIGCPLGLLLT